MIIVVPLLIAAVGAAWTIGYNMSENRVKTLEAQIAAAQTSETLKLPQLLNDLREAAGQLSNQLEVSRKLARTKEELTAAQKRLVELEPLVGKLREAETALKSLYSDVDRFSLKAGESRSLLGYEIGLAVHSASDSGADIVFDNKSATLHPGEEITASRQGKACRLRLDATSGYPNNKADFTFLVAK